MKPTKLLTLTSLSLFICYGSYAKDLATASVDVEFINSAEHNTSNLPFSEAVRVGNILYLSGQIGVDPLTGKLVSGGIQAEAKQTLSNIEQFLASQGLAMEDVIKCTVMLADIAQWQSFNEVYVTYFNKPYPARSAFGASGLALNGSLELECMAYIPSAH
jgi:2-iminobutanoate/2-iminopropanoate deaminase